MDRLSLRVGMVAGTAKAAHAETEECPDAVARPEDASRVIHRRRSQREAAQKHKAVRRHPAGIVDALELVSSAVKGPGES